MTSKQKVLNVYPEATIKRIDTVGKDNPTQYKLVSSNANFTTLAISASVQTAWDKAAIAIALAT
jgi:hypothetical protein